MPKVSVSIPCYNVCTYNKQGAEWLRTAIESVLTQTHTDIELLLIDDGSSDDTIGLLREFTDDDRVEVITQDNRGYPGARNTGIKEGNGEYYAFIGQDDVWEPQLLERQLAYLESNEDDVVHANAHHIDAEGRITGIKHEEGAPEPAGREALIRRLFFGNFICEQSAVCHRSAVADTRFDESFHIMADIDLWLRIADDHSFGYVDEPLVKKRYHGSNISGRYEDHFEERKRLIEKFVSRYPFLEPYRDQRLSNAHLTRAVASLLNGNVTESRQASRKAARLYPKNWRAVAIYALSFGGTTVGQSALRRLSTSNTQ